jgi:hypothetical protein
MLKNAKTTKITITFLRHIPTWFAYQNEGKLKHWLIEILLVGVGYIAVPAESTEPTKTMENFWKNLLRSLIVHRKKCDAKAAWL